VRRTDAHVTPRDGAVRTAPHSHLTGSAGNGPNGRLGWMPPGARGICVVETAPQRRRRTIAFAPGSASACIHSSSVAIVRIARAMVFELSPLWTRRSPSLSTEWSRVALSLVVQAERGGRAGDALPPSPMEGSPERQRGINGKRHDALYERHLSVAGHSRPSRVVRSTGFEPVIFGSAPRASTAQPSFEPVVSRRRAGFCSGAGVRWQVASR
jgi:hypothetical protein